MSEPYSYSPWLYTSTSPNVPQVFHVSHCLHSLRSLSWPFSPSPATQSDLSPSFSPRSIFLSMFLFVLTSLGLCLCVSVSLYLSISRNHMMYCFAYISDMNVNNTLVKDVAEDPELQQGNHSGASFLIVCPADFISKQLWDC